MPPKNGAEKATAKTAVPKVPEPPEALKLLGRKSDGKWLIVASLSKTEDLNEVSLLQIVQQTLDAGQSSMQLGSILVPLGQFYGYQVA